MRPLRHAGLLAVWVVAAVALVLGAVSIYSQAGASPEAPSTPDAVEVADAATAPEPAAVVDHTMSSQETWNICVWWRAVIFGHLANNGGWGIYSHFHVHWWNHRQVRCNFGLNGIILEFLYDIDTGASAFI